MQNKEDKPGLPKSETFQQKILAVNNLNQGNFREWLFLPGMLFGAGEKWWGKGGKRESPHEGIDICYYRTMNHDIKQIEPGTKIPAIYPGVVAAICDDFLGKSIFIKHEQYQRTGTTLYTAYGHIIPTLEIQPGKKVRDGEIIGTAAEPGRNRQTVSCHFHISTAWISDKLPGQQLNWEIMKTVQLFNPLDILALPHTIIDRQ